MNPIMTEGQAIDREQFLKDNKLADVLEIFTERDIAIEELLEFEKDDLRQFAKELSLDVLSQNRLIKAIDKLRPSNNMPLNTGRGTLGGGYSAPQTTGGYLGTMGTLGGGGPLGQKNTHVIVSPEEHEAISKLYERYEDSCKLLEQLKGSFDLLAGSAEKCKVDVDEGFDKLLTNLAQKKTALIEECRSVKEMKKEKLTAQLQSLKDYCEQISSGKKQYEQYISDPNLDIHKRKHAILSMIDEIVNDRKVTMVMITQPKMAFQVDAKQVTKFVDSLVIDDCDQPFPPVVVIQKLEADRIVVTWMLDQKYQTTNTKSILCFGIEWCKLPKSYLKRDDKEKIRKKDKKRKKKKSKKKRKKNRKRRHSTSSDSQSEDEEQEDDIAKPDKPDELEKNKSEGDTQTKPLFKFGAKKEDKEVASKVSKSKKKKSSKKKRKMTESDSESESSSDSDSASSSDSDSDSDSSSDSNSDSESDSNSDSDSESNSSDSDYSSMDSEDDEKRNRRRKGKKGKKKKKVVVVEVEAMSEWKEAEEQKWEVEEIRLRKEESVTKRYRFVVDELRDNTAYAVRVRGKNASGWGHYTVPLKVQTPRLSLNSKILKSKESTILMTKILPKKIRTKKFKLIFHAKKDGFAGNMFHSKCDNKGATLCIFETTTGNKFGGYAAMPWSSSGQYGQDMKAFLFLVKSTQGGKPQMFAQNKVQNAVYHNGSYGPTWGANHDLHICNNCNTTNGSYTNIGNSYGTSVNAHILAGSRNFMIKDYEVWLVK